MIYIFNGPPSSGKDEGCRILTRNLGMAHASFKETLIDETVEYFGVDKEWFLSDYDNREVKEKPVEQLQWLSRREALIYVSEDVMKPKHGLSYFGNKLAEKMEQGVYYAVSDGGFNEELQPLINKFGVDNITVVQLARDGCDYSKDSRRYLNSKHLQEIVLGYKTNIEQDQIYTEQVPVNIIRIHNNGSIRELEEAILTIHEKGRDVYQKDTA